MSSGSSGNSPPQPPAPSSPPTGPAVAAALPAASVVAMQEEVSRALEAVVMSSTGPAASPIEQAIARHLDGSHVTHALDTLRLRELNRHTEATDRLKNQPRNALWGVLVVLVFVILFTWVALSFSKSELVIPVVTAVVGTIGGAIGGYGVGKIQGQKEAKNEADGE